MYKYLPLVASVIILDNILDLRISFKCENILVYLTWAIYFCILPDLKDFYLRKLYIILKWYLDILSFINYICMREVETVNSVITDYEGKL